MSDVPTEVFNHVGAGSRAEKRLVVLMGSSDKGASQAGKSTKPVMRVGAPHPAAPQVVDNRTPRERRESQKGYKKAKRFYNKTYIVTQQQLIFGVMILCGLVILLSVGLFQFYMYVLDGLAKFQ